MVRAAISLDVALGQLNALYPTRSKASDGGIGDAAHSARESDHNPDASGVYHARDFTHDPASGADMTKYVRGLCMDRRATYTIFNNTFYDKVNGNLRIRPYPMVNPAGAKMNPHNHHCHVSVAGGPLGDDGSPWAVFGGTPAPDGGPSSLPNLQAGDVSPAVGTLQKFCNDYDWKPPLPLLAVDGVYGPKTVAVVAAAQRQCGITTGDGRNTGPQTRSAFYARGWRV